MLRFIFIFLFTLILLYSKNDQNSLVYLNDIRQNAGLIPFTYHSKLSKAAKSHATYLMRQRKYGHYEKKGYKGFTGQTPSDRVTHAKYASKMVMENISTNAKNTQDSIDTLMAAIYHRFVFLTFDKNEIGLGKSMNPKSKVLKSAYVYNLGNRGLRKACHKTFKLKSGKRYNTNICKNKQKKIPELYVQKKIKETRKQNAKILVYPYNGQTNISPAFYNETPDPLPGYKVSGYPISVQFNPAFHKQVTLKTFRLFDKKGKEIKKRKILTKDTDINHKFSALQFAFMPLKRLEYNSTYHVEFKAISDGHHLHQDWTFTTKNPKGRLFKIRKKKTTIKIKSKGKIVLYFEPKSKKDILKGVKQKGKFKLIYLDPNTLEVTLPNKRLKGVYSLKTGQRKVILK